MDHSRQSIPATPIAFKVLFICKPKSHLRDVIVRTSSLQVYKNYLRSSRPIVIPKLSNGNLWFYIYIYIYIELFRNDG